MIEEKRFQSQAGTEAQAFTAYQASFGMRFKKQSEADAKGKVNGRWTEEEHKRFLEAVQLYGEKDSKNIAKHIGTRTLK